MAARARLVGLDVARALALLGMVATHLLVELGPDGEQTWPHDLAGGRASALFAVLAGVSLALMTRRGPRLPACLGIAIRALLIGGIGLWLGHLETGLAVILTYYAVLFLLGLPFVALRARTLAVLAAVWVVLAPVVSQAIRPDLPYPTFNNPSPRRVLEDTGPLVSELLFTGYYPAFTWLAYLLAGMAVGRSDLGRRAVQLRLLVGGLVLTAVGVLGSHALTAGRFSQRALDESAFGLYGTTPTNRWAWLLVDAPHSGTPFDLTVTIGSALAVIGGCLLVVGLLPAFGVRAVGVLFGAGTMTLTLYTLHAFLRQDQYWPAGDGAFRDHVLLLAAIGAVFAALRWRGPLELLVGLPGRWLRNRSSRRTVPSS